MRRTISPGVFTTGHFWVALVLTAVPAPRSLAAPAPDEILYELGGLRIFRASSRQGTPVMVLTNLDDEGRALVVVLPALSYPIVSYGGLPGPFRYPDRLYFLGYGPDNNTPVFLGRLGLSSTDRYARAACDVAPTGRGCARESRTAAP